MSFSEIYARKQLLEEMNKTKENEHYKRSHNYSASESYQKEYIEGQINGIRNTINLIESEEEKVKVLKKLKKFLIKNIEGQIGINGETNEVNFKFGNIDIRRLEE